MEQEQITDDFERKTPTVQAKFKGWVTFMIILHIYHWKRSMNWIFHWLFDYVSFWCYKWRRVRAALESSWKRGSFDRISSCQEFWNFQNSKWEIKKISFVLFVSWKRVKTILPVLKSYGWVSCDFSVSSAPIISELRLWEWNLEIWAETSRSWAWQWY